MRSVLLPVFTGLLWSGVIPAEAPWTSLIFALALLQCLTLTWAYQNRRHE